MPDRTKCLQCLLTFLHNCGPVYLTVASLKIHNNEKLMLKDFARFKRVSHDRSHFCKEHDLNTGHPWGYFNNLSEYAKFIWALRTICLASLQSFAGHFEFSPDISLWNVWRISNFSLDILSGELKLLCRTFSKFAGHVRRVRRISRTLNLFAHIGMMKQNMKSLFSSFSLQMPGFACTLFYWRK